MRVSLADVNIDGTCNFDITDGNGVLLLGKVLVLTESVRDQIQARDVSFLEVHPNNVSHLLGAFEKSRKQPHAKDPETL